MEQNAVACPNFAEAKMAELVAYYNQISGLEPVKRFKSKDDAIVAIQAVMAKLEGNAEPVVEEELEEVHQSALSISSQLIAANEGERKTSEKNEGVWLNVKMLLEQGLSNKDILAKLAEMYGNNNTTYACVAWYRNKWKKMVPEVSKEDRANDFGKKYGLSAEAVAELVGMLK